MRNLCSIAIIALSIFGMSAVGEAQSNSGAIVHDAEYYVLHAQNGQRWDAEDPLTTVTQYH